VGFCAITYALDYEKHQEIEAKIMGFKDKVVLITGGGSGIGADAARAFYEAGAKVVLNGRRAELLSQTAAKINPTGNNVAYVAGDIGQAETSRRMVETAVDRFGGVDILLNNAGVFTPKPFLDHTEEDLIDPLLTPEQLASFNAFHPLGRNGQVQDTTAAILFLADDDAAGWITGVVLPVDGGVTAGRN
jgi:NAD(P)-dependent dehydrogenase (short-subunit alcohol dehydrogenase family)